jgi:hypothetical protein
MGKEVRRLLAAAGEQRAAPWLHVRVQLISCTSCRHLVTFNACMQPCRVERRDIPL